MQPCCAAVEGSWKQAVSKQVLQIRNYRPQKVQADEEKPYFSQCGKDRSETIRVRGTASGGATVHSARVHGKSGVCHRRTRYRK
jgi:hypothetical protein